LIAVAKAVAAELDRTDPDHKADYEARLQSFLVSLQPLQQKVKSLRDRYAGTQVTATEPVFGYMAEALGLNVRNQRFQMSVMNETEPSARDVAAFEDDLAKRRVKVLFYNNQTADDLTKRLLNLAKASRVAVVGVSETEPRGMNYQAWMMSQLNALETALTARQ